jgi:hypothetical protein
MAVRDHFRRAVHKSDSSDNLSQTSGTSSSMTATTTTSNTSDSSDGGSSLRKVPTNRLARAFAFGSRDKARDLEKEKEKELERQRKQQQKAKKNKIPLHPRDKPLTAQNLRHQEVLSQFTMTFGSSPNRMSQVITGNVPGISPCCARAGSIDGGIISPVTSRGALESRRPGVVVVG